MYCTFLADYGQKIKKTYDFGQFSQKQEDIYLHLFHLIHPHLLVYLLPFHLLHLHPSSASKQELGHVLALYHCSFSSLLEIPTMCEHMYMYLCLVLTKKEIHLCTHKTNQTVNQYRYLQVNNVI